MTDSTPAVSGSKGLAVTLIVLGHLVLLICLGAFVALGPGLSGVAHWYTDGGIVEVSYPFVFSSAQ